MRPIAAVSSLTLLAAAACTTPQAVEVDVEAERAALMDADRAWYEAYAAGDDGAQAFVDQMADDAVLLAPDTPIAQGKEAIRSAIAGLEALPGFRVSWTPVTADVGSGGDLGYTRGTYDMSFDGPDGAMNVTGKYLTVWKKQADGTWMVVADMFNADAPMTPPM